MEKRLKSFISAILIIAGFIFLFPGLNITGNVVGITETAGKVVNSIVGLALIIGGLVLFLARKSLETIADEPQKLFYEDDSGEIRINDFLGTLSMEKIDTINQSAEEVLREAEETAEDPEMEQMYSEEVFNPVYIRTARYQRDEDKKFPLEKDSIAGMADRFLKTWDSNYTPVIHPLYREMEHEEYLNPRKGVYDSRDVVKLFKDNIGNISNVNVTSHEIPFKYRGVNTKLTAGTIHPYETDKNAVNEALKSIAEIDVKKEKHNKDYEIEDYKRVDALKKNIYEKRLII
ncbi:hypothetical protein GF378_00765 [Candidatus Pacearchaeota archaeon]|nr:hypothetical protein [Candidatus Pacearchaeota archaeon]